MERCGGEAGMTEHTWTAWLAAGGDMGVYEDCQAASLAVDGGVGVSEDPQVALQVVDDSVDVECDPLGGLVGFRGRAVLTGPGRGRGGRGHSLAGKMRPGVPTTSGWVKMRLHDELCSQTGSVPVH